MIHRNPVTDFCGREYQPDVDPSAYVHPVSCVIGRVQLGKKVMVAPFASIRGDEGHPIFVGDEANIQDGVVIHALQTEFLGQPRFENLAEIAGTGYAVCIGNRVSVSHQAQVHGPAFVSHDTFLGMKSLLFRASVGSCCVVEPGAPLMGITVGDGRYVSAGKGIRQQVDADALPLIDEDYPFRLINREGGRVNTALAEGCRRLGP